MAQTLNTLCLSLLLSGLLPAWILADQVGAESAPCTHCDCGGTGYCGARTRSQASKPLQALASASSHQDWQFDRPSSVAWTLDQLASDHRYSSRGTASPSTCRLTPRVRDCRYQI